MPALAALTTFSAGVIQRSPMNGNFAALRTWADNSVVLTDVAKTISASHTFSAAQIFSSTINGQTISSAANFTGTVDIAGVLEIDGQFRLSAAASVIKPGATSLTFRNNADTFDNAVLTDAGVLTVRAGVVVTAGGVTVTAGGLTVTAGGLTVTAGGAAITGNSSITGNLTVTGTFSATGTNTYVRRATDLNFTSSTDSTLTFAIGATDEYEAEYVLFHTNATGTATFTAAVAWPLSATVLIGGLGAESGSATVAGAVAGITLAGFPMDSTLAMTVVRLYVKGGGTAGNLTMAITASAGTGVLKAGSFVRYARIA